MSLARWIAFAASLAATAAPAQDETTRRLEESPRHQEWVTIRSGERTVHAFVVYPEKSEKADAVVVIHENRGLVDWTRAVADRLAEAGYLAIAPDLLSGAAPGGGRTKDFPTGDAAREAIYAVPPEQVIADLDATADWAKALPAASGRVAVAGFCWGGAQSFRFATERNDLSAAFVFYGTPPEAEAMDRIACPVHGIYGSRDARVNATIPATEAAMKERGKTFEPVVYEGAQHAFMRRGEEEGSDPADRAARDAAWTRWIERLRGE